MPSERFSEQPPRYPPEFRVWAGGVLSLSVQYFLEATPHPELFEESIFPANALIRSLAASAQAQDRPFRPLGDTLALIGADFQATVGKLLNQDESLPWPYRSETVAQILEFPKDSPQTIQNFEHMQQQTVNGFGSGLSALTTYHVLQRLYGRNNLPALPVAQVIAQNVHFAFFDQALHQSGDVHWEEYDERNFREYDLLAPGDRTNKFVNPLILRNLTSFEEAGGCLALDPMSQATQDQLNQAGLRVKRATAMVLLSASVSQMVDHIVLWCSRLSPEQQQSLHPLDRNLLQATDPSLPRQPIQPKALF